MRKCEHTHNAHVNIESLQHMMEHLTFVNMYFVYIMLIKCLQTLNIAEKCKENWESCSMLV